MGKRFRTLPSLLWESDEEDGRSLHEAWSSVRAVQACVCKTALAAEVAKTKQLEQDLQTLRLVIQELQQKLKKTEFPVLPRLVVSKPSLSSASRGNPWYWLAHLPKGVQDLPRLREKSFRIYRAVASGALALLLMFANGRWRLICWTTACLVFKASLVSILLCTKLVSLGTLFCGGAKDMRRTPTCNGLR